MGRGGRITPLHRAAARVRRRWHWRQRQREGIEEFPSEYLNWMEFANAGMLHRGHRVLMDRAVSSLPTDDPVVEIGAFCGLSTNVLTYFLERHGRPNRLISADPWVFEGEEAVTLDESEITFREYRELVKSEYIRSTRFWSRDRLPEAVQLSSDEFFAAWGEQRRVTGVLGEEVELGGPISMVFIDGDHTYEQARRDLENAHRWLVPGGYALLDDTDEFGTFPHLFALVHDVIAEQKFELVAANPHHLLRRRPEAA